MLAVHAEEQEDTAKRVTRREGIANIDADLQESLSHWSSRLTSFGVEDNGPRLSCFCLQPLELHRSMPLGSFKVASIDEMYRKCISTLVQKA